MRRAIECVPNLSEGRNTETIEALAQAVQQVPDVRLVNVSADVDHHRTVLTFLGAPEAVAEAAYRCAQIAVERIDLRQHQGVHPRIGAVDVIPFVPLRNVDMSECAELARGVGYRIANELQLPVYFYDYAALPDKPSDLPSIRRGGFEKWVNRPLTGKRAPDAGPNRLHPSAGAAVVGARGPLIAFNIDLDTERLEVAQHIAQTIRQQREVIPELTGVRALGLFLPSRGVAQVSLNLTQPDKSPLWWVLDYVRVQAAHYGVQIKRTELIGVAPADVFVEVSAYYLQNPNLRVEHILDLWMDQDWKP